MRPEKSKITVKEKHWQLRFLHPVQMSFTNEGKKIKTLSGGGKLTAFAMSRPILQEGLKAVLLIGGFHKNGILLLHTYLLTVKRHKQKDWDNYKNWRGKWEDR